jgi:maltose/moltooligosaccharide transporter
MKKPQLSFWEIWTMSFGFLGIQMGFALQNANVSRIFQTLGADMETIPILWLAAPLTGLIVQPIVGFFSDRTWGKLGRRRPYFLAGAIFASIALIVMPNSPVLWFAAGMLWILDASINISMEPFRAFVGDNLSSDQRTSGFAMQSFFIGIGAVVGSYLPWMLTNWLGFANTAAEGQIPESVKYSFYIGAAIFFFAVLWTVWKSNEYSPEELESFDEDKENTSYQPTILTDTNVVQHGKKQTKIGGITLLIGILLSWWFISVNVNKEVYILSIGVSIFGLMLLVSGYMQTKKKYQNGFVTIMNDFGFMPKTMKQLAVVQFFSWFALFSMWIYTTSAVTKTLFGTTDTTSELYNTGANLVGNSFGVYNGVAALVAFLLPVLARYTNRKITHSICLVFGAIGLISIFFLKDPNLLYFSMIGVGVAWASILAMPYAILTGSLPSDKMGYYMGVFNYFIVIPQIVAAAVLGYIVSKVFGNEPIYALIIGGISMILAAIMTQFVDDNDE